MYNAKQQEHLRHNFVVNTFDGAFFGLGLGLSSFVTVLPLFVASLTDSTLLIGLIATIHLIGWQFPQLVTADYIKGLRIIRPMVLKMTLQERWPFLALALVAVFVIEVDRNLALILTLVFVSLQSLGGGLTATAWQSLLSKIMPPAMRGTFYGMQSAAANLMSSIGAVVAGILLGVLPYPFNFAACFALTFVSMMISFAFLSSTREWEHEPPENARRRGRAYWQHLGLILRQDGNFRWFIISRVLMQFAQMALAFYTIYATRAYNMDAPTAGVMTGLLMLGQTLVSPLIGLMGDRWGHRIVLAIGNLFMAAGAALALLAPDLNWFYIVFFLAGVVNAIHWTSILAITVDFGTEAERPIYIGLSNTLTAPATLIAPILGGWLADFSGFELTFGISVLGGIISAFVLVFLLRDPRDHVLTAQSAVSGD